jgi:putative transcriptional regulator
MSKRNLFDELVTGLEEVRQYDQGKVTLRTHAVEEPAVLPELTPAQIRDVRERLNLSQAVFARRLRVRKRTLENWEQGRAKPAGPAATMIHLVRQYPDTLERLAKLG